MGRERDISAGERDSRAFAEELQPVRGILCTDNVHGRPFTSTILKKWIALSAGFLQVQKADVRCGPSTVNRFPELLEYAEVKRLRLSLRTRGDIDTACLKELHALGLFDVYLTISRVDLDLMGRWMESCRELALPLRVQLVFPVDKPFDVSQALQILRRAAAVNLAAFDFFELREPIPADRPVDALKQINELAMGLRAEGIEVNLLHWPTIAVWPENQPHIIHHEGFYQDHQQYRRRAYQLAMKAFLLSPIRLEKALENLLARRTSVHNSIDNAVLPWLLEHPVTYGRVWMIHKLTRHIPYLRRHTRPLMEPIEYEHDDIQWSRLRTKTSLGPVEIRCRHPRRADHEWENFCRRFPNLAAEQRPNDMPAPVHSNRIRYYDSIDAVRCHVSSRRLELAEEARDILLHVPPTREISADDYDIQDRYTEHMPGAVRWHAYTNIELLSTKLSRLQLPFTLSVTFGGGMAAQVGFYLGRHAKIVCPMIEQSHQIALHADEEGNYVLLRDGMLVSPTEFEGVSNVPPRLPDSLMPRLCVYNLDGIILTQRLVVWERPDKKPASRPGLSEIKYSVLIINSRYARRLQAALLALAHQKNFDFRKLEVVIGYVPGLDFTDDLIDSLERTFPQLRLVRSPFNERYARSKGFLINETVSATVGEWLILLDADIILPPDFFARMEKVEGDSHFIAPDGRRMLSADTTARVLLGLEKPWESYDRLLNEAEEYRHRESGGIPIGFCQCVRKKCFDSVGYRELDHFESADYIFGQAIVNGFGKECRLDGVDVLHLDHGGSQWYGVAKQL